MRLRKLISGSSRVAVGVVAALTSSLGSDRANSAQVPASLLPLMEQRTKIAGHLAETIANCVKRKDTKHFVFKGCIDWHSSVHGFWALIAYERASGNRQYSSIVRSGLRPAGLQKEQKFLRSRKGFEMPYGRAWFLRLAIDHWQLTGKATLTPMADQTMQSLMTHYKRHSIDPRSSSYDSASWALINMHDYANQRKDSGAIQIIEGWIRQHFLSGPKRCSHSWEGKGFMAVCTNWAWLAAKVLPRDQLRVWLDRFFSQSGLPRPVRHPVGSHHYGLNFSRSWGLWAIYDATGELKYANAFAEHFRAGYEPPSNWRGSYDAVGHWVAQFGMFALQPVFGRTRGR